MSRKFKSLCALICTAVLMLSMCFSASAVFLEGAELTNVQEETFIPVNVYLNGKYMSDAMMLGGTSYVDAAEFVESILGQSCSRSWSAEESALHILSGDVSLYLNLADHYILINERCIPLGGRVFNIDGSIFVPIRPLARALGAQLRVFGHGENMVIDLRRENGASIISGSEYYNAEDLYWLSRVIFAESGNQPIEGMIGVGNVVLNRVRDDSGLFPDSVQGVIFQSGQFSVVDAGSIYSEPSARSVIAAKLCLEGCSTVGDCLFFLNPSISDSTWFDTNRVFRLSIGEHYFYA